MSNKQLLSIQFNNPSLHPLSFPLPQHPKITKQYLINLNTYLIENTLDSNGNPILWINNRIPSPFTDSILTLSQLNYLLRTHHLLSINILEINFLDPSQYPLFVAIPYLITPNLIIHLTLLLHNYIQQHFHKTIFLIHSQIPSTITGYPITPNDIRHLIYHHQPLHLSFTSTPTENQLYQLQMIPDHQLLRDIQSIQNEIQQEREKIQNDTPYNIPEYIDTLNLELKKYTQEKQKRHL